MTERERERDCTATMVLSQCGMCTSACRYWQQEQSTQKCSAHRL